MRKKVATIEEIADHFDSLPRAAGTAEERVAATAKYFKVKPATVKNHIKFWWPGAKYLKEFESEKRNGRVKWDRPTDELVKVMNREGNVARAAKALKTTSMTLAKALSRHGIEQRWVVGKR
jgi:transcriptional regulator with GAF, ATPase, and Fis domain